jgi:YD repeat-containing protein
MDRELFLLIKTTCLISICFLSVFAFAHVDHAAGSGSGSGSENSSVPIARQLGSTESGKLAVGIPGAGLGDVRTELRLEHQLPPYSIHEPSGQVGVTRVDLSVMVGELAVPLLTRAYNSRARVLGLMGVGWCSNLETLITWDDSQREPQVVKFIPCGRGEAQIFTKLNKQRGRYRAEDGSLLLREADGRWRMDRFPFERFSAKGRLLQFASADGQVWRIEYDNSGAIAVLESARSKVVIERTRDNLLKSFRMGASRVEYDLDLVSGQLKQVRRLTSLLRDSESYSYSSEDLMRSLSRGGREWKFSYNERQSVMSVQEPQQCLVEVKYRQSHLGLVTQSHRHCGGREVASTGSAASGASTTLASESVFESSNADLDRSPAAGEIEIPWDQSGSERLRLSLDAWGRPLEMIAWQGQMVKFRIRARRDPKTGDWTKLETAQTQVRSQDRDASGLKPQQRMILENWEMGLLRLYEHRRARRKS